MKPNGRRRWRIFARNVRQREPGCFSNDSGHGALLRRHPDYAEMAPLPIPDPAFTARSLVGMTMGARKRKAFADWCRLGMRAWPTHAQRWRVGERLRPCPGCEKCTESPKLQVMAWVRFIGGRAVMRRHNSRVYAEAEYGLTIYRPGPRWNPAAARGATRARAWLNMRDCLRRENQIAGICDDSGTIPSRDRKARR